MTSGAPTRPTTTWRSQWSWAFDTPFSWTKQIASHFGGVAAGHGDHVAEGNQGQGRHPQPVPPRHRHRADDPRSGDNQRSPKMVDGIKQSPIEGVSMMYTFDKKNAERAVEAQDAVLRDDGRPCDLSRRLDRQHESRCGRRGSSPERRIRIPPPYPWELYDLTKDWTQSEDVAAKYPAEAQGDGGDFLGGGEEVPGAAARFVGRDAPGHAAAEHHRRTQRVHLDAAAHRHAQRRCTVDPERLLQLQGRGRDSARRRPRAC